MCKQKWWYPVLFGRTMFGAFWRNVGGPTRAFFLCGNNTLFALCQALGL